VNAEREVLRTAYGLRDTAWTALGGELDENFAVDLADGSRVVVKVAPPGADIHLIRWQHELLGLAAEQLRVPTVIPADNGDTVVDIGSSRLAQVHSWLPGRMLADLGSHSAGLLAELGAVAARMTRALATAPVPPASAGHPWDLLRAGETIAAGIGSVAEPERRENVQRIASWYTRALDAHLGSLPRAVVHHDLNDFNVLAERGADGRHTLCGVLDFADALHTTRISELAVAVAYAMLRKTDPLSAATAVVRGYRGEAELTDAELAVLYPMAAIRLCVNAVTWTHRGRGAYARERMKHTWPAITILARTPPELAEALLRDAAGATVAVPVVSVPGARPALPGLDPVPFPPAHAEDAEIGGAARLGGHLRSDAATAARRSAAPTLRLGVEVAAPEPFGVATPLAATVEGNDAALILRHERAGAETLWSRWTGLRTDAAVGTDLAAGAVIGAAGRLHLSLFRSAETAHLATPLRVPAAEAVAWAAVSPDPAGFAGLPPTGAADWDGERALATREAHFAKSQRTYYRRPMNIVGGRGAWLFDEFGRGYLDAINNVSHVGHSNPRVVRAAIAQMGRLNTNSRFLYPGIARYAERLTSLLPGPLEVAFLVCSGSEANDLAVRMARQVTGRRDVIVVDGAYHGNTGTLVGLSPNRYKGPGGAGPDETTHEVEQPNGYRGRFAYGHPDAGREYAADVAWQADQLTARSRPPAAFLAESVMGSAGSVFYPDGYLAEAFAAARAVGALCIADEVQVGFGRLGDAFWGFETQGVVPDIVTMGKPMGNGHPMAAVVTTRAIADAFDTGMKYFNTFGGNPVSCAIGEAVLDEIADRGLQQQAKATGEHFRNALGALAERHELIGDVRGRGMYLGVELVRDRSARTPATAEAMIVSELMKGAGVIVYPTGPTDSVLKIKPPLTFTAADADLFVTVLDGVLARDW
jgi:4-aminobutyrate aminotransferase-like enzyme/Ser/Thr protein kinase RdoA (MazF antagonist)